MSETWSGEFYCVKCKEKRETSGEVHVSGTRHRRVLRSFRERKKPALGGVRLPRAGSAKSREWR